MNLNESFYSVSVSDVIFTENKKSKIKLKIKATITLYIKKKK